MPWALKAAKVPCFDNRSKTSKIFVEKGFRSMKLSKASRKVVLLRWSYKERHWIILSIGLVFNCSCDITKIGEIFSHYIKEYDLTWYCENDFGFSLLKFHFVCHRWIILSLHVRDHHSKLFSVYWLQRLGFHFSFFWRALHAFSANCSFRPTEK